MSERLTAAQVSILTEADIVHLLALDGDIEDALQEAARMGALWAAAIIQKGGGSAYGHEYAYDIREAITEAKPPRNFSRLLP